MVSGELFTYGVLITICKDLDYSASFSLAAVIIIMAFLFLLIVKDPNIRSIHETITPKTPRRSSYLACDFEEMSTYAKYK